MGENLAWLTQKTKEKKVINFTFPTYRVNLIELKRNKKSGNPPFLHQPPFSGLFPLSSKKFRTSLSSPSDSIFGKSYPPPPPFSLIRGGGEIPTMLGCLGFADSFSSTFSKLKIGFLFSDGY